MMSLLRRLNARQASLLLLLLCVGAGASVQAVRYRNGLQAFIAICTLGPAWALGWALTRRIAGPGLAQSLEPGFRYQRRRKSIQVDSDGLSAGTWGLRYRVLWSEITIARLALQHAQPMIQLRVESTARLLREMQPQGQRWRLALVLWINRKVFGCNLFLAPAQVGLDPKALFEEIRSRARPGPPRPFKPPE
jgi:hypothetical protein